ncbi:MAG TPA: tetratricopeptide repeat protein, partial [Terriglobia bacterium]|nr:tetratricopeptide repeat protein [Terriglobia bacterium]
RSANAAAVVRYRQEWNAVCPMDADGLLDRPWAAPEFVRGPHSTPASLLRADFGVMPYLFRDAELEEAVAWCENADAVTPMAIMRVPAYGGAGKTRFAIELCKRLEPHGWVTGMWRDDLELARLPLPRLVVIDYAEEAQAVSLKDSLDALSRHATALAPVRVLLLTRRRTGQARDALTELRRSAPPPTLTRVLDHAEDNLVAGTPLTSEQRTVLYWEAVHRFTEVWCRQAQRGQAKNPAAAPDLSGDRYGVALEVLFEALDHALIQCGYGGKSAPAADDGEDSSRPPAERALAHEEKYWRATAPAAHRDDEDLLRECAALATLAGAADQDEAHALLSIPRQLTGSGMAGTRQKLIAWLSSLYDGPGTLNPLRPDRLGEALASRVLKDQDDVGRTLLGKVLGLVSDGQAERCLDVLARLSAYDDTTASAAAAAICHAHIPLTLRAEEQSHGTRDRPGSTSLASALQRLLTSKFCQLVRQELADAEPGNTTYQRDLSISFNKLADLARNAGRSADAEALYRQSLQVTQELADAEPGNTTYQRDLSVSFNKLADLAVRRGQTEQADQWVQQALEIRRQLCRNEPARLDLAEELAYVLYFSATDLPNHADDEDAKQETRYLLEPFERLGHMTQRASALLAWAHT